MASNAPTLTEAQASQTVGNRYLYQNLVSNLECQIEYWKGKASRDPDPVTSDRLRHKALGLEYAVRLLDAFEPEFPKEVGQ